MAAAADIEALRAQAEAAQADYAAAAAKLSAARRKAAKELGKVVTEAMQTLAMQGGRFEVSVEKATAASAQGDDAGGIPGGRPCRHHASPAGQGRHRAANSPAFRWRCRSLPAAPARVPTLIFDEVDSGVGGAVAEVVGRLLGELGQRHQVLCVTHCPRWRRAAAATTRCSKAEKAGTTHSRIVELDANARVEEIARMLGGIKITATTRATRPGNAGRLKGLPGAPDAGPPSAGRRSLRSVAGTKHHCMAFQREAVVLGDLVLALFDIDVVEFDDLSAVRADKVIVVIPVVQLEHGLAAVELAARRDARLLELRRATR